MEKKYMQQNTDKDLFEYTMYYTLQTNFCGEICFRLRKVLKRESNRKVGYFNPRAMETSGWTMAIPFLYLSYAKDTTPSMI